MCDMKLNKMCDRDLTLWLQVSQMGMTKLSLACSGSFFSSFDKGPVWLAPCLKSSPDVFLVLLLPL